MTYKDVKLVLNIPEELAREADSLRDEDMFLKTFASRATLERLGYKDPTETSDVKLVVVYQQQLEKIVDDFKTNETAHKSFLSYCENRKITNEDSFDLRRSFEEDLVLLIDKVAGYGRFWFRLILEEMAKREGVVVNQKQSQPVVRRGNAVEVGQIRIFSSAKPKGEGLLEQTSKDDKKASMPDRSRNVFTSKMVSSAENPKPQRVFLYEDDLDEIINDFGKKTKSYQAFLEFCDSYDESSNKPSSTEQFEKDLIQSLDEKVKYGSVFYTHVIEEMMKRNGKRVKWD